ncbi:DinB family protein [Flagellimonas meridianipacifica]|uniref:DinB family protein n=1 Tax=Flagellimonas meridianipacifica TaxID=1080225 RepID=A0A2T0MCA3_9FLAO|nr:DinB family protein [Allomuricauda pacifica]PRX55072.1 DinB family protein [Allomuricauda pacifica]
MSLSDSEYHPYYGNYIALSGDAPFLQTLEKGLNEFQDFVSSIPDDRMNYAYDEGKWTVSELLMHLIDAERVFQHRAFRFARNDKTPLPGFEQDDYVPESKAGIRSRKEIIEEFLTVRNSSIQLFKSFNEDILIRMGIASGSPMSVRALGHVICGHQIHHFNVIRERYL